MKHGIFVYVFVFYFTRILKSMQYTYDSGIISHFCHAVIYNHCYSGLVSLVSLFSFQ